MTHEEPALTDRIIRSVKGHLRVAGIAVIFGMTAYGFVHLLIWVVRMVENI
jgi:hypothetical protein